MSRTLAVVLAGGEGERLSLLSGVRAKPAVPFGGKYRIIDFTLSNCVNSGLTNVIVLTQYAPLSLNDHIGAGRPWDLDRNVGGIRILQPFVARGRARGVVSRHGGRRGRRTCDAIQQSGADIVVILAGDHIYKMDYGPFVQQHRRRRADVTIAVKPVPLGEAHRFGVLGLDDNDAVTDWQEKPRQPRSDLASLGIYVFSRKALRHLAGRRAATTSAATSSRPCWRPARASTATASTATGRTWAPWTAIGKPRWSCWTTTPPLDLFDRDWVIHTRSEERPPARIGSTANVHRSLISHGCVIAGTVEHSVLSPGVRVDPGAIVRDSVIMFDCVIRAGAVVDRAILDKEVSVGPNAVVGMGTDFDTPNVAEPERLTTGITVVGKRAIIPASARIGRNVRIAGSVRPSDFRSKRVPSGGSIERRTRKPRSRKA